MSSRLEQLFSRLATGETTLQAAAAPDLSANQITAWLNNPLINPRTNKTLNPNAHSGLFVGFRDKYAKLTVAECQAWENKSLPPPSMIEKGMTQFNENNAILKAYFLSQCRAASSRSSVASRTSVARHASTATPRQMNLIQKIMDSPATAQETIIKNMSYEKRYLAALALMFEPMSPSKKIDAIKVFFPDFDKVSDFELCIGSNAMKKMSFNYQHHCPISFTLNKTLLTGRVYFNLKHIGNLYPIGIEVQDIPSRPKTHLRILIDKNSSTPITISIYQSQSGANTPIELIHNDHILIFLLKFYRELIHNYDAINEQRAFVNLAIKKDRLPSPETLRKELINISLPKNSIQFYHYYRAVFEYEIPESPIRNDTPVVPKTEYTYTPLRDEDDEQTNEMEVKLKPGRFNEEIKCCYYKPPTSPGRQSHLRIYITLTKDKSHLFMKQYSFKMLKPILTQLYAILRVEEPERVRSPFKKISVAIDMVPIELMAFKNSYV